MTALRLGVVLAAGPAPAWIARALRRVVAAGDAEIALVIRPVVAPAREERSLARRVYAQLDARLIGRRDDALAREDLGELLAGRPVVDAADRAAIAAADLDVIAELEPSPDRALHALARRGTLAIALGDALGEVIGRAPVTRVALEQRTRAGELRVAREAWSATDPTSARRHDGRRRWLAAALLARGLRDLRTSTPPAAATGSPEPPSPITAPVVARWAAGLVRGRVERWTARRQWYLAAGLDPTTRGAVPTRALAALRPIVPPADRFWADPFVARHGDGWVVLFEEKLYARPHAHLAGFELAADGTRGEVFPILERDYHLSYPFVFAWDGAWWMVPESARNRTVDLYRAAPFPRRWVLERTLLADVAAVDASPFERDGTWWMFCNIAEPGAAKEDELHLYSARTPLGPWLAHPRNPIVSDVRRARPAGRPYADGGAWFRPAQDGAGGYGSRIRLHRIDRLDPEGYAETEIAGLEPSWSPGLVGLHTINAAEGMTVIDLRAVRRRWR